MPLHQDTHNAQPDSEDANGHRRVLPDDEAERRFTFPEWFREIGRWRGDLTR